MNRIYQILTAAQDLIRDPKHWTQRAYARDRHGAGVGSNHPNAVCWCADGAIRKCGGADRYGSLIPELVAFLKGQPGLVHTNDDNGHAATMDLFERLREKAKALEVAA